MVVSMVRTGVITDEFWAVVEPLLPANGVRRGRPWADHRRTLEGICWRFRTGSPWRDLPMEFGPFQTVWKRHKRWSVDGTYQRMLDAVVGARLSSEVVVELMSVDSTVVRAHQHAAGARRDTGGCSELQELRSPGA